MNIAKYIMLMRCTRFPSKTVGIGPFTTGREVANKLITTRLPGLPVVDKESMEVKGLVNEFDVLGALIEGLDPDSFTADKIMSRNAPTAELDTPAEELMEMMLEKNITMVPITKNNKLAGIVDICSLVELLMTPGSERYFR
jgi:CBS domain-containing protein